MKRRMGSNRLWDFVGKSSLLRSLRMCCLSLCYGAEYSLACFVDLWLSLGIVLVSGFEKINIENYCGRIFGSIVYADACTDNSRNVVGCGLRRVVVSTDCS